MTLSDGKWDLDGRLPWVALGTTVDWGRELGGRDLRNRDLQWGQVCSEEGLPQGVMAEAMERKGAKRKGTQRQPPSGLGEWDREG